MNAYVLRRLLQVVPTILLVSVATFSLLHLSGGDPAELMLGENADPRMVARVRQDLGLDKPLHEQYWNWLSAAARGDLGRSVLPARTSVSSAIVQRAAVTLELGALAMVLSTVVAVPLGVVAALKRGGRIDSLSTAVAVFGLAVPNFLLALILILIVAVWLRWLPPTGYIAPAQDLVQNLRHMILPTITLGLVLAASLIRITRTSVLDVIQREFIRTARAKGLHEGQVVRGHVLKAALIPVVTILGLQLGAVLGGSILVETVFAIPGLGRLTIDAIYSRDLPVLQGVVLVLSISYVLINLAVDLLYGYLDPRVRYG